MASPGPLIQAQRRANSAPRQPPGRTPAGRAGGDRKLAPCKVRSSCRSQGFSRAMPQWVKSATLRVVRGRHKPGLQLAIIASERPSGGRGIGVSFCRGPFEDF
jgi:hypothetical protein